MMITPTFTAREVERNRDGKRIMKVTETGRTAGGSTFAETSYVALAPSRLVMVPVRVQGRFSKEKRPEFVMCTRDNLAAATGCMVQGRFSTLAEARLSLGINTSPKRPNAVAAALAVAERMAA